MVRVNSAADAGRLQWLEGQVIAVNERLRGGAGRIHSGDEFLLQRRRKGDLAGSACKWMRPVVGALTVTVELTRQTLPAPPDTSAEERLSCVTV